MDALRDFVTRRELEKIVRIGHKFHFVVEAAYRSKHKNIHTRNPSLLSSPPATQAHQVPPIPPPPLRAQRHPPQ
ncbi:hypothetical protein J5N97_022822 [Dioscorea zingiberensis]|uniref:Uncharacterized protein n=1 Tax=Dioscorea zingiberensis TaxID=325984 RepID=A0A9D5HB96_9LILI|nr:hypothetical protein J5N97_022822 [Dioscorea zingiberensis]